MNRYNIVIAVFTAIIVALGVNIGVGVNNAEEISHEFTVVCDEHRTLARIAKEEAQETIESNNRLLPKLVITGISHGELNTALQKKTENKARHVAELELIRRETC